MCLYLQRNVCGSLSSHPIECSYLQIFVECNLYMKLQRTDKCQLEARDTFCLVLDYMRQLLCFADKLHLFQLKSVPFCRLFTGNSLNEQFGQEKCNVPDVNLPKFPCRQ